MLQRDDPASFVHQVATVRDSAMQPTMRVLLAVAFVIVSCQAATPEKETLPSIPVRGLLPSQLPFLPAPSGYFPPELFPQSLPLRPLPFVRRLAIPRFPVPRFTIPRFAVPRFAGPRFAVPRLPIPVANRLGLRLPYTESLLGQLPYIVRGRTVIPVPTSVPKTTEDTKDTKAIDTKTDAPVEDNEITSTAEEETKS